jgi:hypothetical protein
MKERPAVMGTDGFQKMLARQQESLEIRFNAERSNDSAARVTNGGSARRTAGFTFFR